MRPFDTTQHQYLERIDALITARMAPHAQQIAREALHSRAVALPRTSMAQLAFAAAQAGTFDQTIYHAGAAIELIRAGAAMHRRLFSSNAHADHRPQSPLHGPTLMLGDYFFALAATEMAVTPHTHIIADYSDCVMRLAEAFLSPTPLNSPDLASHVLHHINMVEGRICTSAIRAGLTCAQQSVDADFSAKLGHTCAQVIALHVHVQQSADPFETLDRGTVMLPVAYAVLADREAALHAITQHDSVALTQLIQRCAGVEQTRATQQQVLASAQLLIDQLPFASMRTSLHELLQTFSIPS